MNRIPNTLLIFYEYPAKDKAMMNDEVRKRYCHGNTEFKEVILCFSVLPWQRNYSTFLTNKRTEFTASTTSLKPITNAPKVGVKKPNAATGIATIL